jgi:hypothetical protein
MVENHELACTPSVLVILHGLVQTVQRRRSFDKLNISCREDIPDLY